MYLKSITDLIVQIKFHKTLSKDVVITDNDLRSQRRKNNLTN